MQTMVRHPSDGIGHRQRLIVWPLTTSRTRL
jgi:hypothetical protein